MARLHLQFRNLNERTKVTTRTLFESGPWSGTDEEKIVKYEQWLKDTSRVYRVPVPTLEIDLSPRVSSREDGYEVGRITLAGWSIVSLFHFYRHHLQAMGSVAAEPGDCSDAQAWSCSLFYSVRPRMFRKRVREGRIVGVNSDDLLSSETLARRLNEMYEDDAPSASPLALEIDTINGTHDRLRPEEDDEESPSVPIIERSQVTPECDSGYIQDVYNVSRSFVSSHAAEMGGWKPEGSSRWRFSLEVVQSYFEQRTANAG